jgi:hypothetical protein
MQLTAFKPILFATEPAIICSDLQSSAANQDYLQLKYVAGHRRQLSISGLLKIKNQFSEQLVYSDHLTSVFCSFSKCLKFAKQHWPDGFLISQAHSPALVRCMTKSFIGSARRAFNADKYCPASISKQ